jgi:site-specific recombinase XerD
VKRLCKWLLRKGLSTVDLAEDVALPRLPKRGRAGIGEANVRAILQAAKGNARDYALLRFLEATGCRRGGIANLLLSDLNMDSPDNRLRRRATVREKFDKSRTVIMTPNALIALEAWLLERPAIPDEHVFLGRENGEDWHPLAPDGVSEIVDRYKERLELVGPCSPHQWRHRFCRKRAQEKMSLGQISQLAGHDDPSITVKFYGEFTVDELQDSYDDIVEDLEI